MSNDAMKSIKLSFTELAEPQMKQRADTFNRLMQTRRSVREFSDRVVWRQIVDRCLITAGSAPSGANRQPWHFAVVSAPAIKKQIRLAAEKEEEEFYSSRAPQDWLEALAPLGTDSNKPFLQAPPI